MDRSRLQTWYERHRSDDTVGAPSPFVEHALDVVADKLSPLAPRRALDLACGRGRHALLLASRGYDVEAVDFALPALITLKRTANARGLHVHCLASDVTSWPLPLARYAVVVVVNFLERALLAPLRAAVAPGGVILYETHRRDERIAPSALRSDFLLAPGELDAAFGDWLVLARHDATTTHDGKPVSRAGILAQRPLEPSAITSAH